MLSETDGLARGTYDPADVQVAAGPTAVVEMVNASIGVWAKSGTALTLESQDSLGSIFSSTTHDLGSDDFTDPRLLYDAQSSRWFFVAYDVTRNELELAASSGTDPAGARWLYSFPSSGCTDQPRLGVSDDVVVFTDNLFSACPGGRLTGGEITVISKQDLLAGASLHWNSYGPSPLYRSIMPVQSLSSASSEYLVALNAFRQAIDVMHVDDPSQTTIPVSHVTLDGLVSDPHDAAQPSGTDLNTDDSRIYDADFQNGSIAFALSDTCDVDSQTLDCVRLVTLDTGSGTITSGGRIYLASSEDMFYPALRTDGAGNKILVFGYSSSTTPPSLGIAAQLADGSNTQWSQLTAGAASDASGRWGDYFGAARDPSDPAVVWVAGQYGSAGGWGTTIAAVSVTEQPPATPPPTSDSGGAGGGGSSSQGSGGSSSSTPPPASPPAAPPTPPTPKPRKSPDFRLSAAPAVAVVRRGGAITVRLGLQRLNGFSARVRVAVGSLPAGVAVTVGTAGAALRIAATTRAVVGRYTITIVATGGGLTRRATLTLRVSR